MTASEKIPCIREINGIKRLMVDSRPFLIQGGEVSNSCSANAEFMETHVWPNVMDLGINTLLVPVAWESVEAQDGKYEFELPARLIDQAEQHGMKLILLWFGLWKNGQSSYVPQWVKMNPQLYYRSIRYQRRGMQTPQCSISPLCEVAVERDAEAFARLMEFLHKRDKNHTVIAVQVENEVGLLGSDMDYVPRATQLFDAQVPPEVAKEFAVQGTWKQAFGQDANGQFMSWCYASAVGRIADRGKQKYSLPMYVNAWTIQYPGEHPGSYPAGGPVIEYRRMWRLMAPAIDWLSPDIYLPDYAAECLKYAADHQPLLVPEATRTSKAASYALFTVGIPHAIGFSPYGIERMGRADQTLTQPCVVQEAFVHVPVDDDKAGLEYRAVNLLLDAIWPDLVACRSKSGVVSRIDRKTKHEGFAIGDFAFRVTWDTHDNADPDSCCLVIQLNENEFYAAGYHCTLEVNSPTGMTKQAEFLSIDEMIIHEGEACALRRLNGDDQWLSFGRQLKLYRFKVHLV